MRKYYKYVTWEQPTLTSNGTMGENEFACDESNRYSSTTVAFRCFNGDITTPSESNRWQVNNVNTSTWYWVSWYNPNKILIKDLTITNNNNGSHCVKAYKIQGSNNNSTWEDIITGTNTNTESMASWQIDMSQNTEAYRYHRIYCQPNSTSSIQITEIEINAFSIVESNESDYDFYKDVDAYFCTKHTTSTYFKTIYEQQLNGTYDVTLQQGDYILELVGAGGGVGGNANDAAGNLGGGGSGAFFKGEISIPETTNYQIVIGKGGSANAQWTPNTGRRGQDGGNSSFGDVIICGGGTAGRGDQQNSSSYGGTGGAVTINSNNIITKTITKTDGMANMWSRGPYAGWAPCTGGMSVYDDTHYGYGAGGWHIDYGNGVDGYCRILQQVTQDDAYDIRNNETTCFGISHYDGLKYYKYQYNTWTQPILISNGTMGGDSFAVYSSETENSYPLYLAFDGNTSNFSSLSLGNIDIYNFNPLNVTNIDITNRSGYTYAITEYTIYGSNNYNNWDTLLTASNSVIASGAVWSMDLSSNSKYYKYYRIDVTNANLGGGTYQIAEIGLTATQQNIVESDSSDYDFTEPYLRKYYKYSSTPWASPILTSNTSAAPEFVTDRYNVFDGNASTGYDVYQEYGQPNCTTNITLDKPTKITSITATQSRNPYDTARGLIYTLYVSSDGTTYTEVFRKEGETNNVATYEVELDDYYQYYRFWAASMGGYDNDRINFREIAFQGEYIDVVEGTASDYDYYVDVIGCKYSFVKF